MQIHDYPIVIFYSPRDECFIAVPPDIPYCSAFGETIEEAAKEIQTALEMWLEAAQEDNYPLPKPNNRPSMLPLLKELRALPDEVEE